MSRPRTAQEIKCSGTRLGRREAWFRPTTHYSVEMGMVGWCHTRHNDVHHNILIQRPVLVNLPRLCLLGPPPRGLAHTHPPVLHGWVLGPPAQALARHQLEARQCIGTRVAIDCGDLRAGGGLGLGGWLWGLGGRRLSGWVVGDGTGPCRRWLGPGWVAAWACVGSSMGQLTVPRTTDSWQAGEQSVPRGRRLAGVEGRQCPEAAAAAHLPLLWHDVAHSRLPAPVYALICARKLLQGRQQWQGGGLCVCGGGGAASERVARRRLLRR
jgi:hypothetical protein